MRDQFGAEMTAEQADHVAHVAQGHIDNLLDPHRSEDRLPAIHREKLASLRKRRDDAQTHAKAVRDAEKRQHEAEARREREADDELLEDAPRQMAHLAQVVEDGRASAEFMAAMVDHVRRVQAAQMAAEQLQRVTAEAAEAANRRGREAPEPPQLGPLPGDTETGLALFNGTVRDKLLRGSSSRIR